MNKRGQATIELALTMFFIVAFLVVLTYVLRITYNWVTLQYAVNEAARSGSLRSGDIESEVVRIADSLNVKNVTVVYPPNGPLSIYELRAETLIVLNPLSGTLLKLTGDNSGTYSVNAQTVIRNEFF